MVPGTTEALCEGIPPAQAPMLRVLATDPAPPQAKVDCEPLESSNFCDGAAAASLTHVRGFTSCLIQLLSNQIDLTSLHLSVHVFVRLVLSPFLDKCLLAGIPCGVYLSYQESGAHCIESESLRAFEPLVPAIAPM